MTIYIVDDDDAVRDSLRTLLEVHGFIVEEFDTAPAFAREYRPNPSACLVLDHNLPEINGLDFLMSPMAAELDLPVILMTGGFDRNLRDRAAAAGVSAFLQKPVSGDALIAAIEEAAEA